MSKRKRGSAADSVYADFVGIFANNPNNNRVALMERMYQRLLTELAANRFKWVNMPESVDVRFLELTLFYTALSVFYRDKDYDKFFALKGGGMNWVNMMDNPVGFSVVGNNFVGKNISAVKETEKAGIGIPIWANYLRAPDIDIVRNYSYKLANIDRTIEINVENARQNKVIVSNENQQLSLSNFDRQVQEGNNSIKVSGPLQDLQFVQALDLGVHPDAHEKIQTLKTKWWSEAMLYLGINNANQDKKERLVGGEVEANDDQVSMMRYVNLNARNEAAKKINKAYGLNISCVFNEDIDKEVERVKSQLQIEDESGAE